MTELVVGKYEFYPCECPRYKEPTLEELEELLKSLKGRKYESARKTAMRPQRRDHDAASADHRVV